MVNPAIQSQCSRHDGNGDLNFCGEKEHREANDEHVHQDGPLDRTVSSQYRSRKPRWWQQKSRKATKAQRRAMQTMQEYMLPRQSYGELIDWNDVFQSDAALDVWLEIGFGSGENLLRLAEQYHGSSKRFIGAEVHDPGSGKALQRMKDAIEKKQFWKDYDLYPSIHDPKFSHVANPISRFTEDCHRSTEISNGWYSNLRIYRGDGVKLLQAIKPHSTQAVLITNPDPFPNSQQEWRLIQTHTVKAIWTVLRASGRLYLATDHAGFFRWSHEILESLMEQDGLFRPIIPCPDRLEWLPVISKYEKRGLQNGRQTYLACWEAI